MHELDDFDGSDDGTVFRDVIMLALLGFMTIVVLLLPHINPPTKAAESLEPPGNVIIEVRWPDGLDADVDLWAAAPGDRPVGYSNQSGKVFNLLRDDLGNVNDASGLNYEIAFSRGAPQGEYAVSLHLYRNHSAAPTVPASVAVKLKRRSDQPAELLMSKDIELRNVGEEVTIVRFELDGNTRLVAGSIHDLPRPLRASGRAAR